MEVPTRNILMLRFDVFEKLHGELYDFWKGILTCYKNENARGFAFTFVENEHIGQKMSPYIYTLGVDSMYAEEPITDIELAQHDIAEKLKLPKVLVSMRARLSRIKDEDKMSAEVKELLQEYYDLENSKKIALREIEKLEYVIKKEMRKFWNRIDAHIINSYKQMLYDITGSHEFAEAFMNNMIRYEPTKDIGIYKRNRNYEMLLGTAGVIDECIESWILDVEILVGVEE